MPLTVPAASTDGPQAHLDVYKNAIDTAHLVKNPSAITDINDYAGVIANSVANIAIAPADMNISESNGDFILTFNAKSGLTKTQDSNTYDVGTATAGSNTSLTDTGASFGSVVGKVVHIKAGTGAGSSAKITANTATGLSFADIGAALDNTSEYEVLDDLVVVYVDSGNSLIKLVKEERTDQAISAASGNSVNVSANTHTIKKTVNVTV